MRGARAFAEFESAWQDCLTRLERAWNKFAGAYSASAFEPWRGRYEHDRTNDELLRYLKQARDAEEHTVGDTVVNEPGATGINASSGKSLYIERMTIDRGAVTIQGAKPGIAVTMIPGRAKLLPAVSRGVTTPIPATHLGNPVVGPDPISVAEAGLAYYEAMLDAAHLRFQ